MLYPGATGAFGLGPDEAPWGEQIRIATPDGEQLSALLSPAQEGSATAIFFHGNADTIANYGFLAKAFAERGMGLLAVSYRGYGGSSGSPSETGLLADGVATFDWLAGRRDGHIVLIGQSLGANVAVSVAAQRPAAAVVLISASDSMAAVARGHYPFLPVKALMRDPFRSDLLIGEVRQPKLFVHGARDTIVPMRHGRALFDLAPEPKEFRILQGYAHNDLWDPELVASITDFLDTELSGKSPAH